MDPRLERVIRQVTSVALATAAVLIPPGVAGLRPSLPLVVAALALAGLGVLARESLPALVDREVVRVHAATLWIGPALAAAILLLYMDLTPGELQTVGALVGLIGMANYLLRPVYYFLSSLLDRVFRFVGV